MPEKPHDQNKPRRLSDSVVARTSLAGWERAERREQAPPEDPLADLLADLGGTDRAAAVILQFMIVCLPPKSYGDTRRFKSGFYRMVAFAWRLSPELLDGCTLDKDVADRLGISPEAFCKHLKAVDDILARGASRVPKLGQPRVLPEPPRE